MRYGIFSDVHGNIEALEGVLEVLASQNVDRYAFLGDAVGYGANPDEVCTRIREVADYAVLGNHDAAVADRMDYSEYYEAARHALDWCRERLSEENLQWLRDLPYKSREGFVEFSHGAPIAPEMFDYLFASDQVEDLVLDDFEQLAEVTFIGHSHLTIAFRVTPDSVRPMIEPVIQCDPEAKYIITDGSVGQPRDRDPRSCCGVFDTETRTFTFHRVEYDVELVRQKILGAGLEPIFGDRLLIGV